MPEFTLYIGNKNYSSWSLRPWLALKQTGAAFEEVLIPLDQPESADDLRRHSPSGRVPVLRHGQILVWESLAICEYLAELFPAAQLWPADAAQRAHARAISSEMHSGFADLRRNLPMDITRRWPAGARLDRVRSDIERITAMWRECRTRFGTEGDFLFGRFTIADAMYAPVTTRFVTYGVPLDPVCEAYAAAVQRWPAMQEWTAAAAREPWVIAYDVNAGST
jgi:glutathione S-transferase